MANLPPESLTLTGGCHCRSVRYVIKVPALGERQLLSGTVDTRIQRGDGANRDDIRVPTRLPIVSIDHCGDCRHAAGVIAQSWFICPVEWVEWTISPRPSRIEGEDDRKEQAVSTHADPAAPGTKRTTLEVCGSPTAELGSAPDIDDDSGTSCFGRYASSSNVIRTFCKCCGTNLSYFDFKRPGPDGLPQLVDVSVGSLDDECLSRVRPERHLWWDYGIGWVEDMFRDGTILNRHSDGSILQELHD